MTKKWFTLAAAAAAALAAGLGGAAATAPGQRLLHELDQRWLGERLMDGLARLSKAEDWASAAALERPQDYRWRAQATRIAHALGEARTDGANTVAALERSYRASLRVFEVDLMRVDGVLRCQHGPEQSARWRDGDCRLEGLLDALPADGWLVLDIKNDFAAAAQQAIAIARARDRLHQLVFQLYHPGHLAQFNRWQADAPALAGPLITAYLSHRSVDHIAHHARRAGVEALTLPLPRARAYRERPAGLGLYVHPVHDCAAATQARAAGAQGSYTLNTLACTATDSIHS